MGEGFVYDYLAGVEFPAWGSVYSGVVPLIPLGRWLMGIAVILFITGIYLSRRRQIFLLETARLGGRKNWWNKQFRNLFLVGMARCLCYASGMKGLDLFLHLPGVGGMEELLILLLWLVHMMTLASIFCLLDLTAFRQMTPAFLFVTEVSTYTVGFFWWDLSKFMFGNWGMYVQSTKVERIYGFSPAAVVLLQCLMIVVIWRLGGVLLERKDNFTV